MGLMTGFNVGVQGLHAAQSGLNTTAHNLANTKTQGYTRQQNIQKDLFYRDFKVTAKATLQIGYGTMVGDIRQIRDAFLDKEYRLEVSRQAFYEKQLETVNEIEDVLGEMEGVEFREALADMWNAVQDLSTYPESVVNRQLFISRAETFIHKATGVYDSISKYQTGLNDQMEKQVNRVNEIAEEIAKYNIKISDSEASGLENANDYRDKRNLLLDELAKITYYTYDEDADGKVQVYIQNAPLVLEGTSYHMHCEKIDEDTKMYKPVWSDNGYGDVYDVDLAYSPERKTDTGTLLGMITARGQKFANYTDLPQKTDPKYYNATGEFLELKFKEDVRKFNNTTGNSIITKVQSQFDNLIHGIVTMMNDVFCPNIKTTAAISATDAEGNAATIPAGSKVLDVINCPVGADDDATVGEELFIRTDCKRYDKYTLEANDVNNNPNLKKYARKNNDGTYTIYVYHEEDPVNEGFTSMYTLRNLKINDKLLANYSLLPVKENESAGNAGAYAQNIYPTLLGNWQSEFSALDPNTLSVYKFDDYYTELVGGLATQGSVWNSIVENQTSLTESIEDKRQQVAGVSTDEELVSLLTYQHAYNASARYINTIDQMLQTLIERLG